MIVTTPAVHPRLRGELTNIHGPLTVDGGSSPLTRGTRVNLTNCLTYVRFIPAYAGNSLASMEPRPNNVGSSPLTRGTLYEQLCAVHGCPVHPRLRGELFRPCESVANVVGSSPLTRGTLPNMIGNSPCPRFIPAYAGNSLALRMMSKSETVHPRLRGELMRSYLINSTDAGSSPLTRGTRRALC